MKAAMLGTKECAQMSKLSSKQINKGIVSIAKEGHTFDLKSDKEQVEAKYLKALRKIQLKKKKEHFKYKIDLRMFENKNAGNAFEIEDGTVDSQDDLSD